MKPIHEMSNVELCEAISDERHEWIISGYMVMTMPVFENHEIKSAKNWLAWENAGKLFEEMPSPCLGPRHHDDHEYMCKSGSHTSEEPCRAPTPTRAIAEAWLQWNSWMHEKVDCPACEGVGNGSVHGLEPAPCSYCNGTGKIERCKK